MTRGVRVRASSVVIVHEEAAPAVLQAILGPTPAFMYAYRCAPLNRLGAEGVAGLTPARLGGRDCCVLLPHTVGLTQHAYLSNLFGVLQGAACGVGNKHWPATAALCQALAPMPLCAGSPGPVSLLQL